MGGSLSEELQAGCPAYFKQADKTYYEASELLARAGNASGSDQATLLAQAVSLMLKVLSRLHVSALRASLPVLLLSAGASPSVLPCCRCHWRATSAE